MFGNNSHVHVFVVGGLSSAKRYCPNDAQSLVSGMQRNIGTDIAAMSACHVFIVSSKAVNP